MIERDLVRSSSLSFPSAAWSASKVEMVEPVLDEDQYRRKEKRKGSEDEPIPQYTPAGSPARRTLRLVEFGPVVNVRVGVGETVSFDDTYSRRLKEEEVAEEVGDAVRGTW
jgi:hypothetical protein